LCGGPETFSEEQQEIIEASAEVLYGLIHARYITSARGMQRMQDKFQRADFGRCKRVHCHGQAVLPTGMSDLPRRYFVSVFCPRCRQLFHPTSRKHMYLDGACE
jgi:casein kinase II subunit beta